MITPISQKDTLWKNVRIGKTNLTIWRWGCTICALCMLLEKLRGYKCSPKDAAHYWRFNAKGEILWLTTQFNGMEFVYRGYWNDIKKVTEYANQPNTGAIIQVNYNHWLYVEKVEGKNLHVIDTIDGKRYSSLPAKYKVTGYALFTSDKPRIPDWAKEPVEKAKERGIEISDPWKEIDLKLMQEILLNLGAIKEIGDMPLYRFLVVLDNMKQL